MEAALHDIDDSPAELKKRLARVQLHSKLRALALVAPLLLFILVSFIWPIGLMLFRSLDNSMVSELLPRTTAALADWNPAETELPPEEVYRAALADIKEGAEAKTINRVGQRLNYEQTGASSLFRRTARKVLGTDLDSIESAKEHLIGIDGKWGSPDIWKLTRIYSDELTLGLLPERP